MCMICGRFPCDSRCPNAPDPPTVYTCAYCVESIVPGDEYMELDGSYYHMDDCASDAAMNLLLEKCGARTGVAEVYDGYDG